MEGKTHKQGIRWKDEQFVWGTLAIRSIMDWTAPVVTYGLAKPIKYVRIPYGELNGKRRRYAQLVCAGMPLTKEKNEVAEGQIGLDLNVSNMAFVGDEQAGLLPFAEGVPTFEEKIHKLQRGMERSRRATTLATMSLTLLPNEDVEGSRKRAKRRRGNGGG